MAHIIRVIDFESSGMDPEQGAQVCEQGWCDVVNDGAGWTVGASGSRLCGVEKMPPEVRAVHHISLAECAPYPPFDPGDLWSASRAAGVMLVAAHNASFESLFWGTPPVPVLCTYKAALRVWPDAPSHSNGALRYWLEDQGQITLEHARTQPAHRAEPDCYTTAHILIALLSTTRANDMVRWTREPPFFPRCPIGEWRGKPWSEVDAGFLRWMVNKPVEPDLVWNAQRELDRRRASA